MNKYLKSIAVGAVAVMTCNVYAGGTETYPESSSSLQFGLSAMYEKTFNSGFAIGVALQNPNFEFGVNTSIEHNKVANGSGYTQYNLMSYLGYRKNIKSNFYGSIGALGGYGFLSGDNVGAGVTHHPYNIGPYVGFEYQANQNVQMFVRIMPYSYERSTNNDLGNEFFEYGQVGISYFF
ncbi:MAG: hypothetical protein P1U63_05100 [Coxiellaceae bacterium]|nr:hypothetical protein [Coxiellaceae bacterium]